MDKGVTTRLFASSSDMVVRNIIDIVPTSGRMSSMQPVDCSCPGAYLVLERGSNRGRGQDSVKPREGEPVTTPLAISGVSCLRNIVTGSLEHSIDTPSG